MTRQDIIVNTVLNDTQSQLMSPFEGMFAEEIESEAMKELIASIQLYTGWCMHVALELSKD